MRKSLKTMLRKLHLLAHRVFLNKMSLFPCPYLWANHYNIGVGVVDFEKKFLHKTIVPKKIRARAVGSKKEFWQDVSCADSELLYQQTVKRF